VSPAERRRILIGIAGGSGSGKTLLAGTLAKAFGAEEVALLPEDAYYRDYPHLSLAERARQNFDHPDAIDEQLLISHLSQLLQGSAIERPVYDFTGYRRTVQTVRIDKQPIVIVEGILILYPSELRELMDIKVYMDTDPDVRLLRRIQRDIQERGRSLQSVVEQYERTVRPMHLLFVEPTKRYADIIVPQGGGNTVAVDLLVTKIAALLQSASAARRPSPAPSPPGRGPG
jgi:uridine kinase